MGKRDIRFAAPRAPRRQLLLYAQSLDELVSADAPVRALARLLDDLDWSAWEEAYEGFGQPPIHPRYLAGAILFGLITRVKSTRDLESSACKHVDFIWLLEGFTPDHSTFAKFRVRHAEAIKGLHAQIAEVLVARRDKALLHLIIDGTRFRADSDWHGARTAGTIEGIIRELERRTAELDSNDATAALGTDYLDGMEPEEGLTQLNTKIAQLEKQRAKYQKALDVARQRDARAQKRNGKKAKPVRVPVTDPESQVTPNKEGGYAPNYTPVATVESQTGAIIHPDVLPGSDEASAVVPAVEAAEDLIGQKPDAVLADGNFASGKVLEALDAEGIDAYMPIRSASPKDNPALRDDPSSPVAEEDRERLPKHGKKFARAAFVYDPEADVYHCPMGHELSPYKHGKDKRGAHCTYYRCQACPACPLAPDCVKREGALRSITRDEYEPLREAAAQRMATPEGEKVYKARAPGIESVFGIIKAALGIRRFSARGLSKVQTEWTWICTAYNLKKLLALEANAVSGGPQTELCQGSRPPKTRLERIMRALLADLTQMANHSMLRASFYLRAGPAW